MRRLAVPRLLVLLLVAAAWAGCARAPEETLDPDAGNARGEPTDSTTPDEPGVDATPDEELEDQPPATVTVTLDARRGPHGDDFARIDRDFYGVNIADWNPDDYLGETRADFLGYLRGIEPGVLRWPAGHTSQMYIWERAPEAEGARRVLTAEHVESFLRLAREVDATPLLAVNVKTGTPEAAADLVRYVNLEQGHGVVWWQLGNEPDHLDGLTSGPEEYAEDILAFARAMRAVDPSIRLVGGEIMTGAHIIPNNSNQRDWMTPIMETSGDVLDAISWHYYPIDSSQKSADSGAYPTRENLLFQEVAPDWRPAGLSFADEVFPHLRELRDAHAPGAQIWVTEMAEDSANGGHADLVGTQVGALWTADILGRFAAQSPDAITKFVFKSGDEHRYTLIDDAYQPRPAYYVYWLFSHHFGDRIVNATSDARPDVMAHAALREDGALALVLVNKEETAHVVDVDLWGFDAASALRYDIVGESYGDTEVDINGVRLTPENAVDAASVPGESFDPRRHVDLAPFSITMLVLEP